MGILTKSFTGLILIAFIASFSVIGSFHAKAYSFGVKICEYYDHGALVHMTTVTTMQSCPDPEGIYAPPDPEEHPHGPKGPTDPEDKEHTIECYKEIEVIEPGG